MEQLDQLIEKSKRTTLTPEEQEAQRRSFAYGNTKLANDKITRAIVDEAADRITKQSKIYS